MKPIKSVKFHTAMKIGEYTEFLVGSSIERLKGAEIYLRDENTMIVKYKGMERCFPMTNVQWYDEFEEVVETKKSKKTVNE